MTTTRTKPTTRKRSKSSLEGGWYPRRRGILEHLERGDLSLLESGIHDFLCLKADHETGVAWVSSVMLKALCPKGTSQRTLRFSMEQLEKHGYIKRFMTKGRRGNYPVLINKFAVQKWVKDGEVVVVSLPQSCRDAKLTWVFTNAERTKTYKEVKFDIETVPAVSLSRDCSDVATAQEVRMKKVCSSSSSERSSPLPHTHSTSDDSPTKGNHPTNPMFDDAPTHRAAPEDVVSTPSGDHLDARLVLQRIGYEYGQLIPEGKPFVISRPDRFEEFKALISEFGTGIVERAILNWTENNRDYILAEGVKFPAGLFLQQCMDTPPGQEWSYIERAQFEDRFEWVAAAFPDATGEEVTELAYKLLDKSN